MRERGRDRGDTRLLSLADNPGVLGLLEEVLKGEGLFCLDDLPLLDLFPGEALHILLPGSLISHNNVELDSVDADAEHNPAIIGGEVCLARGGVRHVESPAGPHMPHILHSREQGITIRKHRCNEREEEKKEMSDLLGVSLQGKFAEISPLVRGREDELVFHVCLRLRVDDLQCHSVPEHVRKPLGIKDPLLHEEFGDGLPLAGNHLIVQESRALQPGRGELEAPARQPRVNRRT